MSLRALQAMHRQVPGCSAHATLTPPTLTNPLSVPRSFGDVPGRERVGALPVFVAALQCLPFVVPSHWADGRLWEDLPAYAIHGDPAMRKVAWGEGLCVNTEDEVPQG